MMESTPLITCGDVAELLEDFNADEASKDALNAAADALSRAGGNRRIAEEDLRQKILLTTNRIDELEIIRNTGGFKDLRDKKEYNDKRNLLSTTQLAKTSLEKDPKKKLSKREKADLDARFCRQQTKISQFMERENIGDEVILFKVRNDARQELLAELSSGKKHGTDYSLDDVTFKVEDILPTFLPSSVLTTASRRPGPAADVASPPWRSTRTRRRTRHRSRTPACPCAAAGQYGHWGSSAESQGDSCRC